MRVLINPKPDERKNQGWTAALGWQSKLLKVALTDIFVDDLKNYYIEQVEVDENGITVRIENKNASE